MLRRAATVFPLILIVVGHLMFLTQGAMIGFGLSSQGANPVNDDKDAPNSYSSNCRCSAHPALSVRVSAALDDVEGQQTSDPNGATDLDLGGEIVTSPDIQDAQFRTDDRQLSRRAERQSGGSGRIHTITYAAQDANGNVTTRQTTVTVPHN